MKYIILQPLSFYAGATLGLTEDHAHVRRAVLKPLGDGLYEVATEANFKAGEVIGFEGVLPKAMAAAMHPVSVPLAGKKGSKPAHDKTKAAG